MKNNILTLTVAGVVLTVLAAGCGQPAPNPTEEAAKGAALKADQQKHEADLARQGQQSGRQ